MKNIKASLQKTAFVAATFLCATSAAFAKDYYYTFYGSGQNSLNTKAAWSQYDSGTSSYIAATEYPPFDATSGLTTNLYLMDNYTSSAAPNNACMLGLNATTFYLNSIVNNTTASTTNPTWTLYCIAPSNGTTTLNVGTITHTADYTTTISTPTTTTTTTATTIIRKRQSDAGMVVNVGTAVNVNAGALYLGGTGAGEFLTNLIFADGADININGTGVTNAPTLTIATNALSFSSTSTINVTYGTLLFAKGVTGTSPTAVNNQNLVMTNAINLNKGGKLNYGTTTSMVGYVDLGDLVVTGTATGTGNVDRAQVYITTSATQGATASDKAIKIGNVILAGESGNDNTRVDLSFNKDTYINSIVSNNIGLSSNAWQGVVINSTSNSTYLGSADVAMRRFTINTNLIVNGNLRNFFREATGQAVSNFVLNGSNSALTILGNFVNDGAVSFDLEKATGSTVQVTMAGLSQTGTTIDSGKRISTDYANTTRTNVQTLLIINGSSDASFYGRLNDIGMGGDLAQYIAESRNYLSLQKDGTGTQYLRGQNYYRGTTTVNSGKLFMNADSSGRASDVARMGIGALVLNGGGFGAIGASTDIGLVIATDLTWNGGKILVDLAANGSADVIEITNSMSKGTGTAFVFEFTVGETYSEDAYKILAWADGSAIGDDFDASDFSAEFVGNDTLSANFEIRSDGLYVTVPEPATFAAIFGALALLAAFIKRRK